MNASSCAVSLPLIGGGRAVVDMKDLPVVQCIPWRQSVSGDRTYAIYRRYVKGKRLNTWLHRLLVGCPDGFDVDHIDHDGLNNRRENLRSCTRQENSRNRAGAPRRAARSSPYRGASALVRSGATVWRCVISIDRKKQIQVGEFETDQLAARAYDSAAKHFFGAFASLNFPNEEPEGYPALIGRLREERTAKRRSRSRLTNSDVARIRSGKERLADLAREFSMHPKYLSKVRSESRLASVAESTVVPMPAGDAS